MPVHLALVFGALRRGLEEASIVVGAGTAAAAAEAGRSQGAHLHSDGPHA